MNTKFNSPYHDYDETQITIWRNNNTITGSCRLFKTTQYFLCICQSYEKELVYVLTKSAYVP